MSIHMLAKHYGWLDCELQHAINNVCNTYENECKVVLANGREVRAPAFPEECTYVRVTQDGYELAYWSVDEFKEGPSPSEVMGAFIGAMVAQSSQKINDHGNADVELTAKDVEFIEITLANNEVSDDVELIQYFIDEIDMSERQARAWVQCRKSYLQDVRGKGNRPKESWALPKAST